MNHKMLTVGQLARKYGLSRTSLLYYDKIGLLSPSERANNSYRYYNEDDEDKLKRILMFRETGISLEKIKTLTDYPLNEDGRDRFILRLFSRIAEINEEISRLKEQQSIIIDLLGKVENAEQFKNNPQELKRLADIIEYTPQFAEKFHRLFEKNSPQKHREFLGLLGYDEADVEHILEMFRAGKDKK